MVQHFRAVFSIIICWASMGIIPIEAQGFQKVITSTNGLKTINIDDVIFRDDQLYIRGNEFIDSLNLWGLFVAALDTNGNVIWHNTVYDTSLQFNWIANAPTRFDISESGDFLLPNKMYESNQLALTVLDSVGNERFTQRYNHIGRTIYPREVRKIGKEFYLFGRVQREDYEGDCYVVKTDSLGNMIWLKYYGLPDQEEGFGGVILNSNGTFTIASSRLSKEFYLQGAHIIGWKAPWVFTIDTSGVIVKEWLGEENDSTTLGGGPFLILPNGDYVIVAKDLKVFPYGISYEVRGSPTVTCLDSNFQLKWKKNLIDFHNGIDVILDLEFDPVNEEVLASGHKIIDYTEELRNREIWLVKFNSEGDILWEITDTINTEKRALHEPAGLEIAPSGSIYIAGSISSLNIPDLHKGWIIKVTPDGCSDTLCTTTSLEEQIRNWDKNVLLYPNPVDDRLIVQIKELQGDADLQISDLQGRVIIRKRVQEGENVVEMDLPSGMYVCTIVSSGKLEYSGKIVVR